MVSVAHVTTAHPAFDNRIFRKECVALDHAGLTVTLVAVADESREVDGIDVVALPRRSSRQSRMVLGPVDAFRVLHKLRPDVVHGHDPELIPILIAYRVTHRSSRVVFDAHEDLPKQVLGKEYLPRWARKPISVLARALEKLADVGCDAIIAATPAIKRNFQNSHVTLVQNYPWLKDFAEPSDYSCAPHGTFSYVGGLSSERGCNEMIAAAGMLNPTGRITVAGPVTPESKTAVMTADHVDYLGIRPATEVPDIVRTAQVGLVLFHPLPNHLECQPTKLFEYMAAQRPFIAADIPYWRSMLGPFECGVFVDPTDTHAISLAMQQLVDDPTRARSMGERGRKAVEQSFSFEGEACRLIDLMSALVKR